LFLAFLQHDERRLAELKAAVDAYPEGVFRYMYAYILFERVELNIVLRYQNNGVNLRKDPERLEKLLLEAGRAMEDVARSPGGWVDFRIAALDMATACFSWAGASQFRTDENPAHLAHAAKLARERFDRFGPPTNGHTLAGMAAALRDEPDRVFTRRVLEAWQTLGPDPSLASAYWAVLEFDSEAYPRALLAAEQAINYPTLPSRHANLIPRLEAIREQSAAALRLPIRPLAPPPRKAYVPAPPPPRAVNR
jgi:hypothetical protein